MKLKRRNFAGYITTTPKAKRPSEKASVRAQLFYY